MSFQALVEKVKGVYLQFPRQWDGKTQMVNLMEEMGELSNAVLVLEGNKPKKRRRAELNDSFADVFFALIMTAEAYGVDLEQVLNQALEEISLRQEKGDYDGE